MRKGITLLLMMMMMTVLLIIGCGSTEAEPEKQERGDAIEEKLKELTLAEKVGQMTMIGVHGKDVDKDSLFMLHQYHCGGVILFSRNVESKEQVRNLTRNLQLQSEEKVPLLIAIDEEGGRVSRMKDVADEEILPAPSQEEQGKSGVEEAKKWARLTAQELKGVGINLNFAPVADIGTPDTRSYSRDAEMVAKYVESAAEGYEEEGVLYCLKHFPGIGKRLTDPHMEISSINETRETLEKEDLLPFKTIIASHDSWKYMIMVSHLRYPALDEENAATLSSKIVTELLRGELKYDGVIITDDLEMGAVSKHGGVKENTLNAVKAGADIILYCHDYAHQQEAYLAILEAVNSGELTEERINESVRRILKVKLNNLK